MLEYSEFSRIETFGIYQVLTDLKSSTEACYFEMHLDLLFHISVLEIYACPNSPPLLLFLVYIQGKCTNLAKSLKPTFALPQFNFWHVSLGQISFVKFTWLNGWFGVNWISNTPALIEQSVSISTLRSSQRGLNQFAHGNIRFIK